MSERGNRGQVLRASQVAPRALDWLWPGRLTLGKLAILDGDPGWDCRAGQEVTTFVGFLECPCYSASARSNQGNRARATNKFEGEGCEGASFRNGRGRR
jgi:hypothetical protein